MSRPLPRWLRSRTAGRRRAGRRETKVTPPLRLRERAKRRRSRGGGVLMALRAVVGGLFGLLGVVCAVVGIFVLEGISIEFPGIMLGAVGYYLGLTSQDRRIQILGITAAALNVISMVISGLSGLPQ